MTKMLFAAVAAAAVLVPQAATAQALPAPVIGVVDIERASTQCNACKTAFATLEGQVNSLKSFQTSLQTPLQTEATAIQTAVNALNGRQPDAALTARIQAFEKKQQDAQRQLSARDQAFQRNRAHVMQQIGTKLDPALATVLAKRGATMLLDSSNVVRFATSVDVTNDLIAALNASLTSVSVTAPAQAARSR
jgi:Skp family chaperone for outer membrane proteins